MFETFDPARPPLTLSRPRWMAFMALKVKSVGMRRI
jgi:hypothetical protein